MEIQDIILEDFKEIKSSVLVIRDIYLVKQWLGKGKFGVVHKAVDITDEQPVAIKTEKADAEYSSIKHEVRIMSYLFQHKFKELPKIHWYGVQSGFVDFSQTSPQVGDEKVTNFSPQVGQSPKDGRRPSRVDAPKAHLPEKFTHLVMCYYEQNFDSLERISSDHIKQCIRILKSIHELFVIHRDIKPQNFMLRGNKLYLIDYGLATFFMDEEGEHVPNKKQETITGTPKFVSYYNHIGNTLSRRDDVISLGYLFIYMLFGKTLPWSEPNSGNIGNALRITKMKSWENISIFTSDFSPIHEYMKYSYSLSYSDDPDYEFLLSLFG